MIFSQKKAVGIVSYGARIPKCKILGQEIAKAQGKSQQKIYESLGVFSKTVPGVDEDTVTLSTAAGLQAIERLVSVGSSATKITKRNILKDIGLLFIGSESHPYAVKPSGTMVAQALGFASDSLSSCLDESYDAKPKPLALADLQFACKAGTQAMQIASMYVKAGFSQYGLAIGADTAQAKPGDLLEYTAGAGAAAFVLGSQTAQKNTLLATFLATTSIATDTPDFWRRPHQKYPEHAGRFTADPGYFTHIELAAKQILLETGLQPKDFGYCIFHTPNAKFPVSVAKKLGFTLEQLKPSLLVEQIGNTYAASSMLGLASTLDVAVPYKKILVVSYGSGAGSDAFILETTPNLAVARKQWQANSITNQTIVNMVSKLEEISYESYRVRV